MKKNDQQIVFTRHTPFLAVDVEILKNEEGQVFPLEKVTALCRCGHSKNKPYCDGSHAAKGLHEIKNEKRKKDNPKDYTGKDITVHFNLGVCSHNAACVKNLPEVFNVRKRPWIMADNAPVEKVIETIKKCPSGALSYTVNGEKHTAFHSKKEILIEKNGPYQVFGGITIKDDLDSRPEIETQYELCRCGLSKNKPFCDGAHKCTKIDEK